MSVILIGAIVSLTWAAYRAVKLAALETGGERLKNLTQQLANLTQSSAADLLTKTATAASDPAVVEFLRSPSGDSRSSVSAALRPLLAQVGKGFLRELRNASKEMAQLIDEVLELARITRSEMHPEVVNLSEQAQLISAELQRDKSQRQVFVNIEKDLIAEGDRRLLRIMLSNLLENALKFTAKRDHPEITFGKQQHNGESTYFIRDNGAGFEMAYVHKLFSAFQRLHSAREFEGTGIGLATVQRIVHRHGGNVWAEGAVNQGATFYFTLPGKPVDFEHFVEATKQLGWYWLALNEAAPAGQKQ